jgi:hypothetical protein
VKTEVKQELEIKVEDEGEDRDDEGVTDRFRGGSSNSNYLVEDEKGLEGVRSKAIGVGLEPD